MRENRMSNTFYITFPVNVQAVSMRSSPLSEPLGIFLANMSDADITIGKKYVECVVKYNKYIINSLTDCESAEHLSLDYV